MQLHLKYNDHIKQLPAAVLLRGNDPLVWLKEVSSWNIPLQNLVFYILPSSLHSTAATGLFVLFNEPEQIKNISVLDMYTKAGPKLYIPCKATLYPKVTEKELNEKLLWPVQVFHPGAGLVGFDEASKINLQDLCSYPDPVQSDWSFAHPGIDEKPMLHEILFNSGTGQELMEKMKGDIGDKLLGEIPVSPEEERSFFSRISDILKMIFFSFLLMIARLFQRKLPADRVPRYQSDNKTNWLTKISDWFTKNLEDVQKKRNDEIQRLLNLFDKNSDEALKYALPINSPYLNRGSDSNSSKLGRNESLFNLGALGGGQITSTWDIGDRYDILYDKYMNAVQKEIAEGNFKKAAYIYAHLLGNYKQAAITLEQGAFYREAAALYRDHLKDMAAAASCLERGGLYLEAIDLYKQLKQHEKTGDLYVKLQQPGHAALFYENSVAAKLSSNDYLDAARLMNDKMLQETRAKETLLQGWKNSFQHEACLQKYIDISLQEDAGGLEFVVKDIYKNHTPAHKKTALLHVLDYANKQSSSEALKIATEELAYEIIHEQAEKGNADVLHQLKFFLPDNKLIASDTSRYSSKVKKAVTGIGLLENIQLDSSIRWMRVLSYQNQFLVAGSKNNLLQLARVNWKGYVEYYSWDHTIENYTQVHLYASPAGNTVILHNTGDAPVSAKMLPKSLYFDKEVTIECPTWLHKGTHQFLITGSNEIVKLEVFQGAMTIYFHTFGGSTKQYMKCAVDENVNLAHVHSNPHIAYIGEYLYTYVNQAFFTISPQGKVLATQLGTGIRSFAVSHYKGQSHIIISTNKGCVLCHPDKGELNMQPQWFAEKMIPVDMAFVKPGIFVLAEKFKIAVFEVKGEDLLLVHQSITIAPVVGILPGAERNKFGVVEEDGKVSMRSFDPS